MAVRLSLFLPKNWSGVMAVDKARIGGPAKGSWPPFEPGNTAALTHGAYATLQLRPRAAEIVERLRDAMGDALEPKHAPAIEVASLAAARVERALGHLLELDEPDIEENFARLDDRARGWLRLYVETLDRLNLVPKVGVSGPVGGVTLNIVTAFPGVHRPTGDIIEIEAEELPVLEEGEVS